MKARILCFGDSNTWGYNTETNGRFSENIRWTGVLAKELGDTYTVIEEGLCGRTTVFDDPLNEGLSGLNYLYPCMMSHAPIDMMIIMLGTNDCKQRFSGTAKNIADGMKRLVQKAKQIDAWRKEPKILIVAPAPIKKECETGMFAGEMGICSDKSYELAKEYERVSKELNCYFWDAAEVVEVNNLDYMHLDPENHKKFAKKITEKIKELMVE